MAGSLTISTLNNDTGVLATQNGMTGIAKIWVYFHGGQDAGNGNYAGTIIGSFNVSSITVNATGDYTINFTTALANANYAVNGTAQWNSDGAASTGAGFNIARRSGAQTTTSCRVYTFVTYSSSNADFQFVSVVINGT